MMATTRMMCQCALKNVRALSPRSRRGALARLALLSSGNAIQPLDHLERRALPGALEPNLVGGAFRVPLRRLGVLQRPAKGFSHAAVVGVGPSEAGGGRLDERALE